MAELGMDISHINSLFIGINSTNICLCLAKFIIGANYTYVRKTWPFNYFEEYILKVRWINANLWERSGSVVECLTRDRRAAGSSLTGVTAL